MSSNAGPGHLPIEDIVAAPGNLLRRVIDSPGSIDGDNPGLSTPRGSSCGEPSIPIAVVADSPRSWRASPSGTPRPPPLDRPVTPSPSFGPCTIAPVISGPAAGSPDPTPCPSPRTRAVGSQVSPSRIAARMRHRRAAHLAASSSARASSSAAHASSPVASSAFDPPFACSAPDPSTMAHSPAAPAPAPLPRPRKRRRMATSPENIALQMWVEHDDGAEFVFCKLKNEQLKGHGYERVEDCACPGKRACEGGSGYECWFHPDGTEVDPDAAVWEGRAPVDSNWNRRLFPQGFRYRCCGAVMGGRFRGCVVGNHVRRKEGGSDWSAIQRLWLESDEAC